MSRASSQQPTKPRPAADYWETSRPRMDLSRLRQARFQAYALRFLLGGAVSVLASLAGHLVTARFGGIFTAFPAILLASLTLIGRKEGQEASAEDAEGGVVGASALVVCAIMLAATLTLLVGALSLLVALGVWTLLALGLYLLCLRLGWLRTFPEQPAPGSTTPQEAPQH